MDKIKIPYTAYYDLDIKDFSEFIKKELLEITLDKYSWIYDIGDNLYYYLENYFKSKGIIYNDTFNEELEDEICQEVYKYLNLC